MYLIGQLLKGVFVRWLGVRAYSKSTTGYLWRGYFHVTDGVVLKGDPVFVGVRRSCREPEPR